MVSLGKNIKKIREQKGLMQKEVASVADMQASNYSKIESGQRDVSVEALDKIANFFGMTVDEIIHFEVSKTPAPVKVEDKTANEKVQLISQLDDEDKNAVYRIIDGMLTKNKFQTFFEQNIQTAK
jgi:transcriptional regulator with XRE-family HTH domain